MKDLIKTNLDQNPKSYPRFDLKYFPKTDILADSIGHMFPEQEHEDSKTLKAKEILGDKYTIEEIKTIVASFEYLINSWMEEYEKKLFNNKTLRELLASL